MDTPIDTGTMADFQREADHYVRRVRETKTPLLLTVEGGGEVVLQDADSYRNMVERLERAEAVAAIRQGMAEFERGEGRPAREALAQLRDKHGLPG